MLYLKNSKLLLNILLTDLLENMADANCQAIGLRSPIFVNSILGLKIKFMKKSVT